MNEEKPSYYSIIPASVRYDNRLTPNAKLLYAEITALCNMNGECNATNAYFAKLYCVSVVSVSKWISQLIQYGYIQSKIIYEEGTKAILKRSLSLFKEPIKEIFKLPIKEKFKDNNTLTESNNNTLTESNINPPISPLDEKEDLFENFWKLYTPIKSSDGHFVSKGNKQSCMKKFNKLLNEGVKNETIINGLKQYLTYCRENGFMSCGVEVFLNQRRFENDYSQSECVDSQRQSNQRRPLGIVAIGNELVKMSNYDESDSIPF